MTQKVKIQRFLKYRYIFMAFTHTIKGNVGPFIKARIRIRSQTSGSDQKGLDPQHCLGVMKLGHTLWTECTEECEVKLQYKYCTFCSTVCLNCFIEWYGE
jgi:hypothetical protein